MAVATKEAEEENKDTEVEEEEVGMLFERGKLENSRHGSYLAVNLCYYRPRISTHSRAHTHSRTHNNTHVAHTQICHPHDISIVTFLKAYNTYSNYLPQHKYTKY